MVYVGKNKDPLVLNLLNLNNTKKCFKSSKFNLRMLRLFKLKLQKKKQKKKKLEFHLFELHLFQLHLFELHFASFVKDSRFKFEFVFEFTFVNLKHFGF